MSRATVYVAAILLALVVLALVVTQRLFSAPHLERRVAAAMGPDYKIDIGSANYNPIRGTFTAEYIAVERDTVRYKDPRRKIWNFTATAVRVEGIKRWALYRKSVDADRIHIQTPRLRVHLDRSIESEIVHRPSTLPQQHLGRLDKPLRAGSIVITDGEIVFSEIPRDGVHPGTIVFADVSAMITNLTNDVDQMNMPCTVDVRTRIADAGDLHAILKYHLDSDSVTMDYEGQIGKMDATLLNKLLVHLSGIHVTGGTIDSVLFDMKVVEDVATGKVRCLYRDVQFELVDKNTHEQDLKEQLATLVYDQKSRASNPEEADEVALTAAVHRRRQAHENVLKFIWLTVRDGLLKTLGVVD